MKRKKRYKQLLELRQWRDNCIKAEGEYRTINQIRKFKYKYQTSVTRVNDEFVRMYVTLNDGHEINFCHIPYGIHELYVVGKHYCYGGKYHN